MDTFQNIVGTILFYVGAITTIFAFVLGMFKGIRATFLKFFKKEAKEKKMEEQLKLLSSSLTDSMKIANERDQSLQDSVNIIKDNLVSLHEKVELIESSEDCKFAELSSMQETLEILKENVKNNDDMNILTLRCQILTIAHRASRYRGITDSDRLLLHDLYQRYHFVMNQNSYITGEFEKAIASPTIENYEIH